MWHHLLHSALSRHPEVSFPGGKEIHFWNTHHRTRGLSWYADLFKDELAVQGEITPAYGFLPVQTIHRIRNWAPEGLRLVYLIRDPRDRAWSSARMALQRAEMTHEEASDQWFIDHFKSNGSMQRGDYEACIRNWRSEFTQDSLLILRHEDLCLDPVAVANRCLLHIGIHRHLFKEEDRDALSKRQFAGDGIPLRPALRSVLDEVYQPRISSLADYLQMDLSAWQR